jgi:uncharacterized protein YdeI (YjbR/CyaY-like superfamily)
MPLVAAATDGDEVDVELELDTAPREVPVPADLAAALDRDPAARQRFDSLSTAAGRHTCSRSRERRRTKPACAASPGWSMPFAGPRDLP